MPIRAWGVLGGLLITAMFQHGQVHAGKEPVMRVLVLETNQLRLRADGDKPLLVFGMGSAQKRISTLKIRKKNSQLMIAMNGNAKRWSYLPQKTQLRIKSKDPRGIWLGKRRYGGELRVFLRSGRLNVVNYVGIEKYLASVVGSEMPKSWPMDALKAQAVAARTYALQQIGKKDFYDVNSTEKSQVYLGIEAETQSTVNAVNSTRALVLLYKGRLINAVFHSSSGGETEESGAVWKRQLPYLVSVPGHDQHSPSYQWKKRFDPHQLKNAFFETGGLERIQILSASKTGRVLSVKVDGPRGDMKLSGKELRRRLGLKSTLVNFELIPLKVRPKKELLNSQYYQSPFRQSPAKQQPTVILDRHVWSKKLNVDSSEKSYSYSAMPLPPPPLPALQPLQTLSSPPPLPPISKNLALVVKGSGAGHGVGMSQWGAYGLAEKGLDFRRILTHYYKGVEIRRFSST